MPAVERPAVAEPPGVSWLDTLAIGEGVASEEVGEAIPGLAPFRLEGLEAEGVSLLEEVPPTSVGAEGKPAPPPEGSEEEWMRSFTLEELGLSSEEIAALQEAAAETREGKPAEEEAALPGVVPFSLEEIEAEKEAPLAEELPGLAPFRLEEAALPEEEAPVGVRPFSLEELGLEEPKGAEIPLPREEGVEALEELEAGLPDNPILRLAFGRRQPCSPAPPRSRQRGKRPRLAPVSSGERPVGRRP